MKYRTEEDSLGEVKVPQDVYYGAQTRRASKNFNIGTETIPLPVIRAFGIVKKAAALTNYELGFLAEEKKDLIVEVCGELIAGELDDQFPLAVWQTGSGTQTNMNVNEVISNRAIELAGGEIGSKDPIHPHDHVNMSQSSNDTFPAAMSIASVKLIQNELIPALKTLKEALQEKEEEFAEIVKTGRTHLMDAAPVTLGQEFSGYASQLEHGLEAIADALPHLKELALGATAVGTGLNTHEEYEEKVINKIASLTGIDFVGASNKFEAIAAHDDIVKASGALKTAAGSLMKIANDIRWLSSGPRCGIGEINLPANEPGSSIMPGKINPTQAEALIQVCIQIMGNDTSINIAGGSGNFELNVCKPIIIYNFLQSVRLLADASRSFTENCVVGIEPNREKIQQYLQNNLMLVAALNPVVGYDKAAEIAQKAHEEEITLKKAAVKLGYLTEEEFEDHVNPEEMTQPAEDLSKDNNF
ncbi:class II fumarate hydratase [Halarsenatibacter silvermanii]|uniref:Fumarate hydratase class II n=1 Tax=Halarsenatibacter silvermanii TaxID=321763 RepID=A0A1G9TMM1_9FIRM|nr:class II fumarate hydratase [Halarsenatibacter silvermanii]SDM49059.1 fumarase, class II [Halarsenatibacter silvermanii]